MKKNPAKKKPDTTTATTFCCEPCGGHLFEQPAVPKNNPYARLTRGLGVFSAIVDVYSVLDAYDVRCPAVQHATKKLLMAGQRGVKSRLQDLKEAKVAIERAIEMEERR